jgi:hypothetical protein
MIRTSCTDRLLCHSDDKLKFAGQALPGNCLASGAQGGFILDVHATQVAINLARQTTQNFSGSNLNQALYTLIDQKFN